MNTITINPAITNIFHDIGATRYFLKPYYKTQKSFYSKAIYNRKKVYQ